MHREIKMKKKNFTKKVNVTALVALLCAVIPLSILPETGIVVVQAENQDFQSVRVADGNTNWKYLDNNTDPAEGHSSLTAWTEKGFDNTAWESSAWK